MVLTTPHVEFSETTAHVELSEITSHCVIEVPEGYLVTTTANQPRKAGIRRGKVSTNPNRRVMSVPVSDAFEEIHEMNQEALRVLAKRA